LISSIQLLTKTPLVPELKVKKNKKKTENT